MKIQKNLGTNQSKKRWLCEYAELMEEIKRECDEAGFWRDRATSITVIPIEPTGVHGNRSKYTSIERFLIVAEECASKCRKLAEEATKRKNLIEQAVDRLEDSDQRRVLKLRYIDRKNFMEIGKIMDFSTDHVWKLHRKALTNLEI